MFGVALERTGGNGCEEDDDGLGVLGRMEVGKRGREETSAVGHRVDAMGTVAEVGRYLDMVWV